MKAKLKNLDEVIKNLRQFLPNYLEEHGIDTSKNFSCLNPKHEDENPSMTCRQNPENAFCLSCGVTSDIFQAAHWLEDKPLSGPGFIEENVKYLAEKFGVDIVLEEMTEEELYRYRTYQAYKDASVIISNLKAGDYKLIKREIKKRGWKLDYLAEAKVGTVNYKDFRSTMWSMGYEPRFQDEIDLGRPDIFNEDNMIFTVCDEWGRPVGFAARNLTYDGSNGSKYTNQKTTGLKCNIYQKGRRLYEVHTAKKYTPPVYIFEGYTDVLTAQQAGLLNCAAIGGTAFTPQHIDLLKQVDMRDIVICLDGDDAGHKKTIELLDKFFRGQRDMRVSVINLPNKMDPDDFIREKGLKEFLNLKKWSAFEWRLYLYSDEDNPDEICKTMIPLIVNESSHIDQDTMCGELSKFTGIDKVTIKSELERLQNEKERVRQQEKETIIDQHFSEIRRSPEDAKTILYQCVTELEAVEEKYNENALSLESAITFIEGQRRVQEEATGEFAGFHLSELGLKGLGEKLNGNWREDVFLCYGGSANSGKTSLVTQLAFEIASNPKNNATVIMHTIDDSGAQILPRLVVQAYGNHDLTLNEVRNPNYYVKREDKELVLQRRKAGYDALMKLVKDGRIILKDANDGMSFAFGESLIRHYRKLYPKRHIVYILDNLHKTPDYAKMKEPRMRFKALSNHMKETATRHHVCIVSTVEYTKLPPRTVPNNNNIAETRAIIYDASFIGHLYNDLHECGDENIAVCRHEHNGEILPRIALGIGKNKITDFKGRIFLDMFPSSGIFRAVPTLVGEEEMRQRMAELRQRGRDYQKPIRTDVNNQEG